MARRKILVIDDEKDIQAIIRGVFQHAGDQVQQHIAESPTTAYLAKPAQPEEMKAAVDRLLGAS